MTAELAALLYLASGVLFILTLRGLSSPETSRQGNLFGMIGMALAVGVTLAVVFFPAETDDATAPERALALADPLTWILILGGVAVGGAIGTVIAGRIPMTAMPQLVAAFHSLVGLTAVLVAAAALLSPDSFGILKFLCTNPDGPNLEDCYGIKGLSLIELGLGSAIGAITFSGSVIAFAKLNGNMSGAPILLPGRHLINIALGLGIVALLMLLIEDRGNTHWPFWALTALAFVVGVTLIIPIGGADMPVVVSMLNSYSGWAAAALGFTLENTALLITGALVGSSGAILSYIMCKGMNRSFVSVILGGFGQDGAAAAQDMGDQTVKRGSADDAAFIMKNASKVIIVPGYGMAVAQAQHALKEMADKLKAEGVDVAYAIHPVAGRMPGHMNVLLAEAQVPYDEVFELEDINSEFGQADVAFVIGANDVTNPAAEDDPSSPIYGMPVLKVWNAQTCFFVKRSLGSGYAGVQNPLFFRDNTMMLLADAKKMVEDIVKAL